MATLLNRLPDDIPADLRDELDELDRLGDRRGMIVACQAAGFLPTNLPIEIIERYLAVAYAVKVAKLRYNPPAIPVTLTHYLAKDRDRAWVMDGWERVAAHVEYVEVDGDHMTMVEPPHAQALAERISEAMERASRASSHDASESDRLPASLVNDGIAISG
jgi:thioesterase domain-containing protein